MTLGAPRLSVTAAGQGSPDAGGLRPAAVLVLCLLVTLLAPAGLPGQEPAPGEGRPEPPPDAQDEATAPDAPGRSGVPEEPGGEEPSLDDLDQLLGGEEEILAGGGYNYDPAGRRDPFKSLLVVSEVPELGGPRPDGIPGLLIDEVMLTGIFSTPDGRVAQVQSADGMKSYLLREGDELYDGDVVRITENEIVFKQIVQDPTALKPFRDVVKALNTEP